MEGTMSQIVHLGPSFDFMKSKKIIMHDIKSKLGPISTVWDEITVQYMPWKVQNMYCW